MQQAPTLDSVLTAQGAYGNNSASPQPIGGANISPPTTQVSPQPQSAPTSLDRALQQMGAYNQPSINTTSLPQAQSESPLTTLIKAGAVGIGTIGNEINKIILPDSYSAAIKSYGDNLDLQQQTLESINPKSAMVGKFLGQGAASLVDAGLAGEVASTFPGFSLLGKAAPYAATGANILTQGAVMGAEQPVLNNQTRAGNAALGAGVNLATAGLLKGIGSLVGQASEVPANIAAGKALQNADPTTLVNNVISNALKLPTGSQAELNSAAWAGYKQVRTSVTNQEDALYTTAQTLGDKSNIIPGKDILTNYINNLESNAQYGATDITNSVISAGKKLLGDMPTYKDFNSAMDLIKQLKTQAYEAGASSPTLQKALLQLKDVAMEDITKAAQNNPELLNSLNIANQYAHDVAYPIKSLAGSEQMMENLNSADFVKKVIGGIQHSPKLLDAFNQLPQDVQGQISGSLVQSMKQASIKNGTFNMNTFANSFQNQATRNPILMPLANQFNAIADNLFTLQSAIKALNQTRSGWMGQLLGMGVGATIGGGLGGAAGSVVTPVIKQQFMLAAAGKLINNPQMSEFLSQYSDIALNSGSSVIKNALSSRIQQGIMSSISDTLSGLASYSGTRIGKWAKDNISLLGFPDDTRNDGTPKSLGIRG